MEHKCWSDAIQAWCALNNFSRVYEKDKLTPYQRRHGADKRFEGKLVAFGAKVHYLPTAEREVLQRQKMAPKMVEGLFAGYKLHTDGKWRGEYKVYDRVSYENWKGVRPLPVHVTKELYLPGEAADSKDRDEFQFPVRDGDWNSQAPTLNRYIQGRYKKRPKPGPAASNDSVAGGVPTIDPPPAAEQAELSSPDMFDDMTSKLEAKRRRMDGESPDTAEETTTPGTTTGPPPDSWERRGEYLVVLHHRPRNTLFSPTQWLIETGNKAIPVFDAEGHFTFYDLEQLDVIRETEPDSTYM